MSTLAPPDALRADPPVDAERCSPARGATRAFARGGAAVLGLRIAALALAVGTSVLLARLLGAAGLGVYETAMGWAALLGVPAGVGAEKLLVREVAAARAHGRPALVRGLARASVTAVVSSAALVAAVTAVAVLALGDRTPTGLLLVACAIVPLAALVRVRQAVVQGLSHVVRGQVPELLIAPATFVVLLGAIAALGSDLTPITALACQAAAFAVALVVASLTLRASTPAEVRDARPQTAWPAWSRAALPLLAIAGLQVLNARVDVVLLGALAEPAEVGRYACANRLAALVAMPLLAANAALGPTVARLHAGGDRTALQAAITRSARLTFAAALPIGLALLIGGELALAVFGPDFVAAREVLNVLAVAQLANVAMGSVGLILLMTGHARTAVQGLAVSAALNVGLDLALIPDHGATGAAIAAGSSLVVWNVLLLVGVRRRLALRPTALGGQR